MLILMECVLDLVVLDLFLIVHCPLQAYQLFIIPHEQVSGRNLASKISLSVPLSDGQNLSWLSKFSLFEVLDYMGCCLLTILFGYSELMFRKVWWSVFVLNILVCNLLFLIYISVSRNEILSFDIS